jgi:hypothetical protein
MLVVKVRRGIVPADEPDVVEVYLFYRIETDSSTTSAEYERLKLKVADRNEKGRRGRRGGRLPPFAYSDQRQTSLASLFHSYHSNSLAAVRTNAFASLPSLQYHQDLGTLESDLFGPGLESISALNARHPVALAVERLYSSSRCARREPFQTRPNDALDAL